MNKGNKYKTSKVYPVVPWALPTAQSSKESKYSFNLSDMWKRQNIFEQGYTRNSPVTRKDQFKNYTQNILYQLDEDKNRTNREDQFGVDYEDYMTKRGMKRRFNRMNPKKSLIPKGSEFTNVIGGGLLGDVLTWGLSTIDEFRPGSYDLNPVQHTKREKRKYRKALLKELENNPEYSGFSKRKLKKLARTITDETISTDRSIDEKEYQQQKVVNTSDEDMYYDKETGMLRNYQDMDATLYNRFAKERSYMHPNIFGTSYMDKNTGEITYKNPLAGDLIEQNQPGATAVGWNQDGLFGSMHYDHTIDEDRYGKDHPLLGNRVFKHNIWDPDNPEADVINKSEQEINNEDFLNDQRANNYGYTDEEWNALSQQEKNVIIANAKIDNPDGGPIDMGDVVGDVDENGMPTGNKNFKPPNLKEGGEQKEKRHIVNAHMSPAEVSLLEKDGTLPNRIKKKGITKINESTNSKNDEYDTVKLVKIDGSYKLVYNNKLSSADRAAKKMQSQAQFGTEFKYSDLDFFKKGGEKKLPKAQSNYMPNNPEGIDYNESAANYGININQLDYETNMPKVGAISTYGDVWGDMGEGEMGWVDATEEEHGFTTPDSDTYGTVKSAFDPGVNRNVNNMFTASAINQNMRTAAADTYGVRRRDIDVNTYTPEAGSINKDYGDVWDDESGWTDKTNVTPDSEFDFAGDDNTLSRRQLRKVRKADRRQDRAEEEGFASWDEMKQEKRNLRDQKKTQRKADRKKWGDTWLDRRVNKANAFLDKPWVQTASKIGKAAVEGAKIGNKLLEDRDRRRREDKFNRSFTSDDVFTSEQASNRGHWDINTGIGWQDQKTISRMGKYGTEMADLPKGQFNYFSSRDGKSNLAQSSKLAGTVFLGDFLTRALGTGIQNRGNYKDAYNDYVANQGSGWYDEMCTEQGCPSWEENRLELLDGHSEPNFAWFKGTDDNLFGKRSVMNKNNVLQGDDLLSAYWQDAKRAGKDALWTGAINYGLNYLGDRTRIGRNISDWWQDKNLPTINVGYLSRRDGGSLPKAQSNINIPADNTSVYIPPTINKDAIDNSYRSPNFLNKMTYGLFGDEGNPDGEMNVDPNLIADYNVESMDGPGYVGGTMPFIGTAPQLIGAAAEGIYDYFNPEGGDFGDWMGWSNKRDGGSLYKAQPGTQVDPQRRNLFFNRIKEVSTMKPFDATKYQSMYPTIAYNQGSRKDINQGSLMDLAPKVIFPTTPDDRRYKADDQSDYARDGVEIDLDMYKQLLAAGADIEII